MEQERILAARGRKLQIPAIRFEAANEPWVARCNEDFVGLALSGGGIRSATFNLGLLQGLHRLNLLHCVDYLATVSGGGYIGGFWSRWLKENAVNGTAPKEPFPDELKKSAKHFAGDSRVFEAKEVRHLREFGKFLVPRIGIFDTETWGGIVALLAAAGTSILAALSVLGLSLIGWLLLTFYLACPEGWGRMSFAIVITALTFYVMERWWRREPTGIQTSADKRRILMSSILALLLIAILAWLDTDPWKVHLYVRKLGWTSVAVPSTYENWWWLTGIRLPPDFTHAEWTFVPRLYEPAIAWTLVGVFFLVIRHRGAFVAPSLEQRVILSTHDRTAMRLLGLATFWAVVATFWHVGLNLSRLQISSLVIGSGAAGSAGLFSLLRNWIGEELVRSHKASLWERFKPYVPQILAYLTIGLAWAAIAAGLINLNGDDWYDWYGATAIMATFVVLILFVDPHEFGLHAAYRDRICRAFLGAVAPPTGTAEQRITDFRSTDDIELTSLLERPLHLICCAANNLSGDHLATLSRGASGVVLSRDGVAMSNHWKSEPDLQLGSAITASAAAANSNMGSVSMRVGPAVSFLMAALNLRLGVWVRSPRMQSPPLRDRLFPGVLFYKEMAALTNTLAQELQLSDGAHFDNLGLYELVRRHCRYIIVSDCTADSDVAFDDFGNTARRIREDFGVEIDIDLAPLRPGADGLSRQHASVGKIDYGWFDKGTLIYIKPSLTGNEPVDTRQ